MIVSLIGLSSMVVSRLNLRSVSGRQDRREARILADSAIELGTGVVTQDTGWRSNLVNGTLYPSTSLTLGNGTISWKLVDTDGNLADDDSDAVRLYGIGRVGQSIYTKSVLLEPAGAGAACLEVALHSGGRINLYNSFDCNQTISSNDEVRATGPTANTDAEAVNQIVGSFSGTQTTGITPRKIPGASVFDYYVNNGTPIKIENLPSSGGRRMLEKVVLSPGDNPYGAGATNPEGIYVIDCKNQNLRIKLVRLVGTLVLLNPGSGTDLDDDQHWEPAVRNFPVLMVNGRITFNWHGEHPLRESLSAVNYNPPGTPYLGQSDSDQADEYPALIKGLIYVAGDLTVDHQCILEGVTVVGGITTTNAPINLTYDPIHLASPPPGFRSGPEMAISHGSWRREASN
jgi:hypothetical protein